MSVARQGKGRVPRRMHLRNNKVVADSRKVDRQNHLISCELITNYHGMLEVYVMYYIRQTGSLAY